MRRVFKKIINYGIALLTLTRLSNAHSVKAHQSNNSINIEVSADLFNKNVFRGVTYSNHPVLQPNISIGYASLSANIWSNIGLGNGKLSEVDYTLEHHRQIGSRLNTSLGYTLYTFPNPFKGNTQEIYTRIGLETKLNPCLIMVVDFKQGRGVYGELSIGHEFVKGPNINAAIHYNHSYFREGNGLSHGTIFFSKQFPIRGTTLSPKLAIAKSLSKGFKHEVYGGLNLRF